MTRIPVTAAYLPPRETALSDVLADVVPELNTAKMMRISVTKTYADLIRTSDKSSEEAGAKQAASSGGRCGVSIFRRKKGKGVISYALEIRQVESCHR